MEPIQPDAVRQAVGLLQVCDEVSAAYLCLDHGRTMRPESDYLGPFWASECGQVDRYHQKTVQLQPGRSVVASRSCLRFGIFDRGQNRRVKGRTLLCGRDCSACPARLSRTQPSTISLLTAAWLVRSVAIQLATCSRARAFCSGNGAISMRRHRTRSAGGNRLCSMLTCR